MPDAYEITYSPERSNAIKTVTVKAYSRKQALKKLFGRYPGNKTILEVNVHRHKCVSCGKSDYKMPTDYKEWKRWGGRA